MARALVEVAPDLHNVLELLEDLHQMESGPPGAKRLRRRGEDDPDQHDAVQHDAVQHDPGPQRPVGLCSDEHGVSAAVFGLLVSYVAVGLSLLVALLLAAVLVGLVVPVGARCDADGPGRAQPSRSYRALCPAARPGDPGPGRAGTLASQRRSSEQPARRSGGGAVWVNNTWQRPRSIDRGRCHELAVRRLCGDGRRRTRWPSRRPAATAH